MEQLVYHLKSEEKVTFVLDNDCQLNWLEKLPVANVDRFYVIVDKYINLNWNEKLTQRLSQNKKKIIWIEYESIEKNKSVNNFVSLVNILEKKGLTRFDLIIGIGGGVLLDIVSFTASVYMRGIKLILIPTTLIGQVDAATAGKTCVNTESSKNLLGTLYMPLYVYNNIRFLDTLNEYHWRQGSSEIFKYGLLGSVKLLKLLSEINEKKSDALLIKIIKETIKVRLNIRLTDPLASNLGHTFGHALEKISKYTIGHGDAIASGILMALKFGELQNITHKGTFKDVLTRMDKLKLCKYFDNSWSIDSIVNLMLKDKKSSSTKINLVMIKNISNRYSADSSPFYETNEQEIEKFLNWYFDKYKQFSVKNLPKLLVNGFRK